MAGDALYDRYKDALKRGHVASLKGRLDEALDAYAEASRIAPERATPHASAGTALMRRKRPADALRYYEAALSLASRDETSMLGRAQALTALDRRREAADAYDRLAEHRAGNGKLADAVDASRRGLELAENRERRRTLERLIERLKASRPGEPGRVALERAMRVLEGPAVVVTAAATPATPTTEEGEFDADVLAAAAALKGAGAAREAIGERAEGEPETEPSPEVLAAAGAVADVVLDEEPEAAIDGEAEAGIDAAVDGDTGAEADLAVAAPEAQDVSETEGVPGAEPDHGAEAQPEPEPGAEPEPEAAVEAAAEPEPEPRAALDRDLPPGVGADELEVRAETALEAGDPADAVERLLDLAAASRAEGRAAAAIDACYVALSLDPDHVGLHLALVQLYDDNGWGALATEKLDLLDRLVTLDEDADGAGQLAAARAGRA